MSMLVVAYPNLARSDLQWIYALQLRDSQLRHSTLALHFTLVFPVSTIDEHVLARHVGKQVAGYGRIQFVLRSSMLVKDDSNDNYYILLVPDEGLSRIVKLHDWLYTGVLAPALRLDLPFIPHITVGYSPDAQRCKLHVDFINQRALEIAGELSRLDLVAKGEDGTRTVAEFSLE